MDPSRLREYVESYDRRHAAKVEECQRSAERARAAVPALARLCRSYGCARVRLFGSLATGRFGARPDIDLAIEGLPPERFFDLYGKLLSAAPADVDLVEWETCPPSLRARIEADGVDV